MSPLYLFIKVYPAFGIVLGFFFFDLARTLKRGANKAWMAVIAISLLCFVTSVLWLVGRGDRNADQWYHTIMSWFRVS
jgi:hypothetical protein